MNGEQAEGADGIFRRLALAVLLVGLVGTLAELLLLEHWDGWKQWVPLALLGLAIATTAVLWLVPGRVTVLATRAVMSLALVSGAVGVWFHYQGNVEFELEMEPALSGWPLFAEAMTGATPALAPGAMAWCGLLGLLVTWRHPAARRADSSGRG